jgi:hypothetical protein
MSIHGRRPADSRDPEASMHPVPAVGHGTAAVPDPYHVDLTDPDLAIPDDAPALLITAVDAPGGVFEGDWLTTLDWTRRWDGEVIAEVSFCHEHDAPAHGVHLILHLVHDGRVLPLGTWCGVQGHWPAVLRGPAGSAMSLHTDLETAQYQCAEQPAVIPGG